MKVCILGSNLTSLTLAKALVNQKINVHLVYSKNPVRYHNSRTLGISKSNVEFFNKNIINIEKIIWKLNRIEIFSDNFKKEKLLKFEKKNEQMFSIIKNFELFSILAKSLSKNKYFKKIYTNMKQEDFECYDIVINSDYENPLTKKFFYKKITKNYNSLAFVTTIKHANIENDTATQIFTKRGPLAFLPISKSETSIVYSLHNSKDKKKENIKDLIHHYNHKYEIKKIGVIKSFELKSLNLRSYHHKNILAFGDIIHKIHPLAGQGFNMTIRDIKVLLGLINDKIELGLPLDYSINIEFEKILRHKNFIFSNGIDLIHEFFNLERKFKNNILSKSVHFMGKNSSINNFFTRIADNGGYF